MIVLFSDYCAERASVAWVKARKALTCGDYAMARECESIAQELDLKASHARPAFVRAVRSQTSFAIDPQGAA